MATPSETTAFEGFIFRVGQKIKTKLPGYDTGFVIERSLNEDAGGIQRLYLVRHGAEHFETYREFEIQETV